jgi:hypothetical protein
VVDPRPHAHVNARAEKGGEQDQCDDSPRHAGSALGRERLSPSDGLGATRALRAAGNPVKPAAARYERINRAC